MKLDTISLICQHLNLDINSAELEANSENYFKLVFDFYTLICDTSPYVVLLDNDKCRNEIYIEPKKKEKIKSILNLAHNTH